MIGKVDRVKLREVWKHEAKDFTCWLEENIDVLNDITNLDLVSAEINSEEISKLNELYINNINE